MTKPQALFSLDKLATSNLNKAKEFSRLLGREIVAVPLPLRELQPSNEHLKLLKARESWIGVASSIAGEKAREAYRCNDGSSILIEDSALFIEALEGLPGPLIAFFSSPVWLQYLCQCVHTPVHGSPRSSFALATVTLAAWSGDEHTPARTWIGEVEGSIAREPRGTNGFGWDTIFIPAGHDRTFAEMSSAEKDSISMRRRAVDNLLAQPFALPE